MARRAPWRPWRFVVEDQGAEVDRRELLWAGALALAGVLAGCRERDDPSARSDRGTDDGAGGAGSDNGGGSRPDRPSASDDPATDDAPADDPTGDAEDVPEADERDEVTVEVICREAIGLAAATEGARAHRIRQLTLHHSAVELGDNRHAPDRLLRHQRHHQEQGWADIAYHYAVDLRGNVYELRDPATVGDTFTDYDPTGHFLVVCEGNYEIEQPTDAMLSAVAELLAHAADEYDVGIDTLTGHRDHDPSVACPGDHLQRRLGELRTRAQQLQADASPRLASVCGEEGRRRVERIRAG